MKAALAAAILAAAPLAAPLAGGASDLQGLRAECASGNGAACTAAADRLQAGSPQDAPREALSLYERACSLADGTGCFRAAGAYMNGWMGVEKSLPLAVRHLDEGCGFGHGRACFTLGVFYREGLSVAKDEPRAVRLFRRACEIGGGKECFDNEFLH